MPTLTPRRPGATRRWGGRLLGAAALAGALAWVPYRVYQADGYARHRQMRDQLDDLSRQNQGLRDRNQSLRREIRRLRTDPEAVGQVARDELGLVKPGEIVIQIERGDPQ
jgi:cell division protein FtsB